MPSQRRVVDSSLIARLLTGNSPTRSSSPCCRNRTTLDRKARRTACPSRFRNGQDTRNVPLRPRAQGESSLPTIWPQIATLTICLGGASPTSRFRIFTVIIRVARAGDKLVRFVRVDDPMFARGRGKHLAINGSFSAVDSLYLAKRRLGSRSAVVPTSAATWCHEWCQLASRQVPCSAK